jgi:hypothetical protein
MRFAVFGAVLLLPSAALALDVRVYPAGSIYVQRSNPDHGCVDLTVRPGHRARSIPFVFDDLFPPVATMETSCGPSSTAMQRIES